ncbi:MAG: PQQ-binding-like beta-propeller repeat protein [Cellulosilyticaceae bacterium]
MGALRERRIISLYLCIVLICGCMPCTTNAEVTRKAPIIFTQNAIAKNIAVTTGSVIQSDLSLTELEDGKGVVIDSINQTLQEQISATLDFETAITTSQMINMKINMAIKTSEVVTVDLYLYNYELEDYEKVDTIESNEAFNHVELGIDATKTLTYLKENDLKARLVCKADKKVRLELDYFLPCIGYQPDELQQAIKTYNVQNLIIEKGTTASGTTKNLNDLDQNSLEITSVDNKVAWQTSIVLDETRKQLRTLKLCYSGKTSTPTNNVWLSLYRNDTQNWEVITNLTSTGQKDYREVSLSDEKYFKTYVSDEGVIKIRLYNSATQSFIKSTDFLSAQIIYDTDDNVQWLDYETMNVEYGTLLPNNSNTGDISIASDNQNKVAVQTKYGCDIDKEQIYSLSVIMDTNVNQPINNQYLSLYNHKSNKFVVFKTQEKINGVSQILLTLREPLQIDQYISENGEITCRIYNSAPKPFVRTIQAFKVVIEYSDLQGFEIAQLSDVHELIGQPNFKQIIREINEVTKPDFTIITGDITDHGTKQQYEQYIEDKKDFNNPVYTLPGNHDVRWWNSNGKKDYINKIGPLYQAFEYEGIYFMMLDSTVTWELDGKVSKEQIAWIKEQLEPISKDMPIILFAHHPFKMNNNVTARHELFEVFKGYNVIAFMAGHLHYYGSLKEDGIPTNYITYIKDNADQDYVTIKFTPRNYYIYQHKASCGSKTLWQAGSLKNRHEQTIEVENIEVQPNGDVKLSVQLNGEEVSKAQARIDNYGPYTLLEKTGSNWEGTIQINEYTPKIPYGKHFVAIEMFDAKNEKWTEYKDYEWIQGPTGLKWIFETNNMVQSTPTYDANKIYVGSEDNYIYCINADNGKKIWSYRTGGDIISKPAIGKINMQNIVVIGSSGGSVYALDSETGEKVWASGIGESVLSDPLIASNTIFIGTGDGKIYALDLLDGSPKWFYQTGGLMRQRPFYHEGVLYANIRDTAIWYAIDAQTGVLRWKGNANTDESYFVCGDVRPLIMNNKLWCIDAQNTRPGFLNLNTGDLEWTASIPNVSSRGMATNGRYVFYSSNSGRQIHAIDVKTNQIIWEKDLRYMGRDSDLQEIQIDSALICEGNRLYHVAERGRITVLAAASGEILWQNDVVGLPERVFWSTPEVHNGTVYVSGIDGNIYCIQTQ